jgi:hypothetical protein
MSNQHDTTRQQGPRRLLGLPYDLRRPTTTRLRSRAWNPDDPHILTPKTFGWGFGLNFYWLVHPRQLVQARRPRRDQEGGGCSSPPADPPPGRS